METEVLWLTCLHLLKALLGSTCAISPPGFSSLCEVGHDIGFEITGKEYLLPETWSFSEKYLLRCQIKRLWPAIRDANGMGQEWKPQK